MSSKAMSLKSKIKNYAKKNNITAQVVLQNYMFERFLARLSQSEYKNKFVIKGGMLIAAMGRIRYPCDYGFGCYCKRYGTKGRKITKCDRIYRGN